MFEKKWQQFVDIAAQKLHWERITGNRRVLTKGSRKEADMHSAWGAQGEQGQHSISQS